MQNNTTGLFYWLLASTSIIFYAKLANGIFMRILKKNKVVY